MTAVFNAPVLPVVSEDLFGGCHLGSFTGDSVRDSPCIFTFYPVSYSFNFECLGDMGEFQIRGYPRHWPINK
ncbi:hypothetical protein JCM39068_37720 [Desulfocastanea catecholica]